MGKSISHVQGKGSLEHNNRKFITNNVDRKRIKDNIIFIQEPIKDAYHKLFDKAVADFNAKQKRADRKKKDSYFEDLFNRPPCQTVLTAANKEKSFYEDVVQIGLMEDTGIGTKDAEAAKECLIEYMKGFQERNPQFYVFNAVLHMDEATPHLHIDYIPVAKGYKTGLAVRNGIAKALEQMGYGKNKDAISKWRDSERQVLKGICESRGIEINEEERGIDRKYLSVPEYKNMKVQEAMINKEIEIKQQQYEDIVSELKPLCEIKENLQQVEEWGKPSTFSKNKIVMQKENYEKMKNGYEMAMLHKDSLSESAPIRDRANSLVRNAYHHNEKLLLETKAKANEILYTAERERSSIAEAEKQRIQESMKRAVMQKEKALQAAQMELQKAQKIREEAEKTVAARAEQEVRRIRQEMQRDLTMQKSAKIAAEKAKNEAEKLLKTEQNRIEQAIKAAESAGYANIEKELKQAQKEREEAERLKRELTEALSETHEKAREQASTIQRVKILQEEKNALERIVDRLESESDEQKKNISELKEENTKLKEENNSLKSALNKLKNMAYTLIIRAVSVSNHLKYVLANADLTDFVHSNLKAAQQYAEETCKKAPLAPEGREEVDKLIRNGTRNQKITDEAEVISEKLKQERNRFHGMTR